MKIFARVLLILLVVSSPVWAQREFGFDNRKASGQPYLKPEETVARMKVAPEFEIKLFAGEPDCVNPIAFTIDEKGRIWVVECFEYPSRTPKGKAPRDRIVILEDTDGDGKCDKRTIFAEGKDFPVSEERKKAGLGAFDLASGIEVGHGGVFIGAPPYLWFIENKNDKPGKFEILLRGFGSQDTHETLNTFQWGPDGWLYGLHGVFTQSNVKPLDGPETRMNAAVWRFHPKARTFEIFSEGTSNPWGMDWRHSDGQFVLACCVIPHLYHMVPGGIYKRQAGGSYNPYAYSQINEICDHTFHKESGWAHAGLIALDVPHIPEKYRKSVIFGSIHGCSVKQNILEPNGSSYIARRGDDFLVSGDKNFRPINMKWGPQGDIYLIDWHDQNPCHQAQADSWDYERGRVYRIQLKGRKPEKNEDMSKLDSEVLIGGVLPRTNDPYRVRTALRLLSERREQLTADQKDKATTLFSTGAATEIERLQGWWGAVAAGALEGKRYLEVARKLENPASLRAATVRYAATAGRDEGIGQLAELAKKDPSPMVRRELASAAVRLSERKDVLPLLRALMLRTEDVNDPQIPHLIWVAYEKIISRKEGAKTPVADELKWLAEQAPGNILVRDQMVPKVMRRLVATGQPEDLRLCLEFVRDVTDLNTREKALDGLAIALAGQTTNAPAVWSSLQAELRREPRLVNLTNKLSVSFRDPEALKRANEMVHNTQKSAAERSEALKQMVLLKHPQANTTICNFLVFGGEPEGFLMECARQVGALDDPKIGEFFVTNWAKTPPFVRAELANSLASRKEWARTLLSAMRDKKIERTVATDNTIIKMQSFRDREIDALIEKAWGRVRSTPAELNKLIDKMRSELDSTPGSFDAGRLVFENQCAKCHKFDGKGHEVGPNIEGAGRDIEYLLTNILDPNRVIGAPYFLRTVNTKDGRVETGVLHEENEKTITLKIENGVFKKIQRDDIEDMKVQEKSLMPEGLGYNMTVQNFRDLIVYVMAHPFATEIQGRITLAEKKDSPIQFKPTVGVTGRITLPDVKTPAQANLSFRVDAPAEMKARLLLGIKGDSVVTINGVPYRINGSGRPAQPDQTGTEVSLKAGENIVQLTFEYVGKNEAVYARFLDPDRKLRYSKSSK